jgi:hypothetical protein
MRRSMRVWVRVGTTPTMRRNDRAGESSPVDMHGGYLLLFAGVHWAGFSLDTIFVRKEQSTFAFAALVRYYSDCVAGTRCVLKGYLFNFPCDVKRQTPTIVIPSAHSCEGCVLR